MAHFEAGISVQRTGRYDNSGRALWRLLRDLIFKSAEFGSIVVPEGFVTNYASVPRLPIVYWYCGDRVYEEPALHDYLYTVRHLPRVEADKIFLESLLSNPKIPDGMARTMYAAVRVFGNSSWFDETNIKQPAHIQGMISPADLWKV